MERKTLVILVPQSKYPEILKMGAFFNTVKGFVFVFNIICVVSYTSGAQVQITSNFTDKIGFE